MVKSEGKVLKRTEQDFISAWNTYSPTFNLQLMYFGTATSSLQLYPALAIGPLVTFNPTRRPWYQVAASNRGLIALTAPYVDAAISNTVSTIASTTFADQSEKTVLGVGAVDLTYLPLHSFVFSSTGCRLLQSDVNTPACFLFDESGILTTSFRFFDPIIDPVTNSTPIRTVFIGEDEPELAQALIRDGLISESIVDDFSQASNPARRTFPYKVNEAVLAGGTLAGSFSSPCQSGSYYAMKVSGTNMYLVVCDVRFIIFICIDFKPISILSSYEI